LILEGACEVRLEGGTARETFALLHRSIPGLTLARATVDRWGSGRYLLVTRAVYYVDHLDRGVIVRALSRGEVFWKAVACLFKPGWLRTAKLLLKGWLRHNHTDFQDAISQATRAEWVEQIGQVIDEGIVFPDGTTVPQKTGVWRNRSFTSSRLVLYAHHDESPGLSAQDLESVAALQAAGADVIVLSTSIAPSIGQTLDVAGVLVRPNVGHDFLSWRIGLREFRAEIARARELIFTNNSVILRDLSFVDVIAAFNAPFACFAENLQGVPHAESVWWQIRLDLVGTEVLEGFFQTIVAHSAKQPIIVKYEHGFSPYMAARGFRYHALWPFEVLAEELQKRRKRFAALYRQFRRERTVSPSKTMYPLLRDLGVGIYKKTAKLAVG
jgi:hypothetical protein